MVKIMHHCVMNMNFQFNCFFRAPLRIPEVDISEDKARRMAHALRNDINRVLSLLRDVALGRDLKKFLMVCSFYFGVSKWN
jgi:Reticulon